MKPHNVSTADTWTKHGRDDCAVKKIKKYLGKSLYTMRWSKKKLMVAGTSVVVVWLFVFYYFPLELPKPVPVQSKMEEFEGMLEDLESQLLTQNQEISKLLDTVKAHLQKAESTAKEEAKQNEAEEIAIAQPPSAAVLPVLVMACDRVTVRRCLENLVKFRPDNTMFPIIVSQDCGHNATYQVIKSFVDADPSITVVRQPDLSQIILPRSQIKFRGYYKIARHYKFALNYVFQILGHDAVIIVEDDLDISPDFFEYFQGTYPLLLQDQTIWCVSAWNDNGKRHVIDINHPELLHRTDFFPGLGWTLRKATWLELEPKWPLAFFDDWLRDPKNTRGRSCIRPEVSRTYSFGKVGVSKGQFFENHLKFNQLNEQYIEFTKLDLRYLLKENYDAALQKDIEEAVTMTADEVMSLPLAEPASEETPQAAKVFYNDARTFQKYAKKLGLMDDFRSGIPRTAYNGTVTCFVRGRRVYLTPNFKWTTYNPNWG